MKRSRKPQALDVVFAASSTQALSDSPVPILPEGRPTATGRGNSKFGPDSGAIAPIKRVSLRKQLAALLSGVGQTATERQPMDCFVAKSAGRVTFVRFPEIDWIETANNHVKVHVSNETHLMRQTMATIEARLPADRFLRISRSAIVNLERMRELQRHPHNGYSIILRNGDQLKLSRGYRKKLRWAVHG